MTRHWHNAEIWQRRVNESPALNVLKRYFINRVLSIRLINNFKAITVKLFILIY